MGSVIQNRMLSAGKDLHYFAACGFNASHFTSDSRSKRKIRCPSKYVNFTQRTPSKNRDAHSYTVPPFDQLADPASKDAAVFVLGDNMFTWQAQGAKRIAKRPRESALRPMIERLLAKLPAGMPGRWYGPT